MKSSLRRLLAELGHWTAPGGAILAAVLLWIRFDPESPILGEISEGYPLVVLGASFLLAWRLRRSRVGGAVLAVTLLYAVSGGLPGVADAGTDPGVVRALALVGAPLAWLGLALLRDHPVFSRRGVLPLLMGLAVPGATVAVGRAWPERLQDLWDAEPLLPVLEWSVPVDVVLPALWLGLLLQVALGQKEPVTRGLVWSLAATEIALLPGIGQPRTGALLTAGGVILGVSVVESSFRLAYHDDLTGLPGRRALEHALDDLGRTYTLAMVDVDHFKKFNDRHGHEVGDQVLRLVASRLERSSGPGRAFRYGGEEFTLVYPGIPPEEAEPHLDAVRRSVARARFVLRGPGREKKGPEARRTRRKSGGGGSKKERSLSVTVSIGSAGPTSGARAPRAVLERADQALYRAKRKGRNRVVAS